MGVPTYGAIILDETLDNVSVTARINEDLFLSAVRKYLWESLLC